MKKVIIAVLAVFCTQALMSQTANFIATYQMGFPSGKFSDYISKPTFRGIGIEVTKRIKTDLDLGIESAWNLFYEHVDHDTYTEGTASVSGEQFRYTNMVPILLTGKYYLKSSSGHPIRPYAGLGVGTLFVDRYTDFGLYRITNDTWQFALRPELGIAIHSEGKPTVIIGAKYFAGFNNNELDGQSYFTINVGISVPGY